MGEPISTVWWKRRGSSPSGQSVRSSTDFVEGPSNSFWPDWWKTKSSIGLNFNSWRARLPEPSLFRKENDDGHQPGCLSDGHLDPILRTGGNRRRRTVRAEQPKRGCLACRMDDGRLRNAVAACGPGP